MYVPSLVSNEIVRSGLMGSSLSRRVVSPVAGACANAGKAAKVERTSEERAMRMPAEYARDGPAWGRNAVNSTAVLRSVPRSQWIV